MSRSYHKRNKKSWKLSASQFVDIMVLCKPEWYAKNRILFVLIRLIEMRIKGLKEKQLDNNHADTIMSG